MFPSSRDRIMAVWIVLGVLLQAEKLGILEYTLMKDSCPNIEGVIVIFWIFFQIL